tara:strand:+ start:634 stop:750 length:117 start_codon:yes stop_codon:yes gene_type:complete
MAGVMSRSANVLIEAALAKLGREVGRASYINVFIMMIV